MGTRVHINDSIQVNCFQCLYIAPLEVQFNVSHSLRVSHSIQPSYEIWQRTFACELEDAFESYGRNVDGPKPCWRTTPN
jgi:hypothetical protein